MNDEGLAEQQPLTPFVYPDFTQEVHRKLLPTRAKEAQRRLPREALIYEAFLWRVGSRLDLERAHNPLYWGFDANPRAQQIAELPIPLGFEPKGALIRSRRHRNATETKMCAR